MKKALRVLAFVAGGSILVCLIAAVISAASNRALPTGPESTDHLAPLDRARLEETL